MEYRTLGRLGWKVSEIGFGAWAIGGDMWGSQDDAQSIQTLHHAIDRGVNFIDTAQGYGKGHSETLIGQVLKERTEEVYVATKVPPTPEATWPTPPDSNSAILYPAEYVIQECEKSLRRLQRETIDIYQFHTWASAFNEQDDWYEAILKLKAQGKIRAVGASVPDMAPECVIGSLINGRIDTVQVIYNLFEQTARWNLFPVCEKTGTGVIVRVPFDESALTGKLKKDTVFTDNDVRKRYFRGGNLAAVVDRVEKIRAFKNLRHERMSMPEYALRFCLNHPAVSTVIPGMRNVEQVEMNIAASNGILLKEDELIGLRQFYWHKDFWWEEVS